MKSTFFPFFLFSPLLSFFSQDLNRVKGLSSEDRAKRGLLRLGKFWLKKCSFFEKIKIDTLRRSGIFENRQNFYSAWRPRIFRGTMNIVPPAPERTPFLFLLHIRIVHIKMHTLTKFEHLETTELRDTANIRFFFNFFPNFEKIQWNSYVTYQKCPKGKKNHEKGKGKNVWDLIKNTVKIAEYIFESVF